MSSMRSGGLTLTLLLVRFWLLMYPLLGGGLVG